MKKLTKLMLRKDHLLLSDDEMSMIIGGYRGEVSFEESCFQTSYACGGTCSDYQWFDQDGRFHSEPRTCIPYQWIDGKDMSCMCAVPTGSY